MLNVCQASNASSFSLIDERSLNRTMVRTILDLALGSRPDFVKRQLSHAVRDPLGRAYNRTSRLPECRGMMQKWTDDLDNLKIEKGVISSQR